MTFVQRMLAPFAIAVVPVAVSGCAGVSVGEGASAVSGGLFNLFAEAAIVVGRGAADVGNSVLDTVPFPAPAKATVAAQPPSVPAPPMQ